MIPVGQDFIQIVMNPVRQRIIQYLLIHGSGTTGEMKKELSDIPPASLYRHVKVLLEAGCIEVMDEKKIRGATEKTYRLVEKPPFVQEMSEADIGMIFQSGMLSLMSEFQKYFAREDADPQRDMLSFSTSTLMLTDEEFMEFLQKIGEVYNGVICNKPAKGRKPRQITIISSPSGEVK